MAARRRVGVVLLIPEPARTEIQGLRRGLGDGARERIPPHLTLVPPVNVREDRIPDALAVLRAGASRVPDRLRLALGPPTTFLPDNPVLYLTVDGELDMLHALRDRVFSEPLERPLTWPFVPHVTIADDASPERIAAAVTALADLRLEVDFGAVHLLEERDRRWEPAAEARFGEPRVIGRGGLQTDLSTAGTLDAEAAAFARVEWERFDAEEYGQASAAEAPFAVVARRGGAVVGVASGELDRPNRAAHLGELLVGAGERSTGVGTHLLAAAEDIARQAGCRRLTVHADRATPAAGFYRARGFEDEAVLPSWKFGRDFVRLVRVLR